MTVFIGVDQALRKMGVCVLRDGTIDRLQLIRPPSKLKGPARLQLLRDELLQLFKDAKIRRGSVTGAALEAQSLGSLGDIDQLGQINGVVQVVLTDLKVVPLKVPPATLKKFVSGHPQATKAQMRSATQRWWDIDIDNDDLCDAHGLARFAEEAALQQSTLRHQIEAVYGLLRKKKRKPRVKKLSAVNI